MTGLNHKITATATLALIGASPLELLFTFFFSTIPDRVERIGTKRILVHRGWSHDIGLWSLLLFIFTWDTLFPPHIFRLSPLFSFRTWVLIYPGWFHVLIDAFYKKGVPFFGFFRVSLPILDYGRLNEHFVAWGILIIACCVEGTNLIARVISGAKIIFLELRKRNPEFLIF
ncbi:MAG: hypothetical protein JRI45_11875 [Deltaproteobacteria bacterium]|nr:hypothetical protein [Deltaproteobacteria bacterium]MBW2069580.1 hypothetical protein [Deltaproteobacteria bacterium]